jgi:23S rRNA pseudouridine2605 synthase
LRLNKYIAACGIASRRGADELIAAGKITVNGELIITMGYDVNTSSDVVCLNGELIRIDQTMVYIMLNKPAGVLSSCSDDRGRETVIDLLDGIDARVFPVGRLDFDTEGLLLLTNDGDFAYKCTHPKYEVAKKYYAVVKGVLSDHAIETLCGSVVLDGQRTAGAIIDIISKTSKRTELYITIHEGKNRHIKKLFLLAGCRVSSLKRVAVGDLQLGNLPVGKWRSLSAPEIQKLTQI